MELKETTLLSDFYSLGFSSVYAVSGIHSQGLGDMLDEVVSYFNTEKEDEIVDDDRIKIAIIGRPNVGKSSLTNALIGEERVISSSIEGTTTDSIDTFIEKDSKKYTIIDTAGMRKRGKIFQGVEKYSVLRALESIERANICLVVIDASKGIIENDLHIAGFAKDAGKGIIVVVNKWDLIEKNDKTMDEWREVLKKEFNFISYAPIVFVSSTKSALNLLLEVISLCKPLTKSPTGTSIVFPFSSSRTIF